MKILNFYLLLILTLLACSTAPVEKVQLFFDHDGYDVKCGYDIDHCKSFASSLCSGKYRVHNVTDIPDISMRVECVKTAQAEKECQETGVSCVL